MVNALQLLHFVVYTRDKVITLTVAKQEELRLYADAPPLLVPMQLGLALGASCHEVLAARSWDLAVGLAGKALGCRVA